ncbi:MAG: Hpt domain-containing protein, partial [Schwartzia sp.]|nr:Hpt domain-containing protein [Schwartzia sp. (in: firmicutes)]
VQLGLRYCGNMEKVYWRLLPLFCRMREEKQKEIEDALAQENWKDYTTFVHALKSSSLSIGGQPCSEAAKALELAGKRYLDEEATEDDKKEALEYIRANHQACMALYDELAAAGEKTVQEHQANG